MLCEYLSTYSFLSFLLTSTLPFYFNGEILEAMTYIFVSVKPNIMYNRGFPECAWKLTVSGVQEHLILPHLREKLSCASSKTKSSMISFMDWTRVHHLGQRLSNTVFVWTKGVTKAKSAVKADLPTRDNRENKTQEPTVQLLWSLTINSYFLTYHSISACF